MMEQWIRATFRVVPNGWEDADGNISDAFVFISGGREVTAPIAWFASTFNVSKPPTAAALKAKDPEDKLGWHRHFDEWVRQGIIQP